jgi:hypothetical protein
MATRILAALAAGGLLLSACDGTSDRTPRPDASLEILSGPAEWVSGGDARIAVVPRVGGSGSLELWLNGSQLEDAELRSINGRLEGVIDGLDLGENTLELRHSSHGLLDSLTLTNHPITGPMFSGPQQYPFVCMTVHQFGVQPLVDAAEPPGFPVRDDKDQIIGYSRDCSMEPIVSYEYRNTSGAFNPLPDGALPGDIEMIGADEDNEGTPFIVRWERGTINRFIYSHAMLAPEGENPDDPDTSLWDGRVLFYMQGGVGIGHNQGRYDKTRAFQADLLAQGYAVLYSTGTRTGEHYNLEVGGETAMMVKENFIKRYGVPRYTVGTGPSGGGIQQYVYAQNHPGLLDASVPVQSYTDMVSQTIHIGDCELLEHYMDVTDGDNTKWHTTENRIWLVGLNATDDRPDPFAGAKQMLGYGTAPGSTECIPAWRGLTPLAMNPHFGSVREQDKMEPAGIMNDVHWTHYDDLRNIYGVDDEGWARSSWDNVGVQYGLQALNDGNITPEEFLDLNARIGGWKQPKDMVQEGFPFVGTEEWALEDPFNRFDPWSRRNMMLSDDPEVPAPRTEGSIEAIQGSYRHGMVFDGQIDIPTIDWRPYLEHKLDMHNVHQSFGVRQRIANRMGDTGHQLIWFTDARPDGNFDQTRMALEVIEEWMTNIEANPEAGVAANRPAAAVDSCFDNDGELIAAGEDVWNGILDDLAPGACTDVFPIYSNSRMVAGAPIEGGIFKCALQSVDDALAAGLYGSWTPNEEQRARLDAIFPDGVCDYSQPDLGRPADM